MCDQELDADRFDKSSGRNCKECSSTIESLQRQARKRYGKDYGKKWKALRSDAGDFKRIVNRYQAANAGSTVRKLNMDLEELFTERAVGNRSVRRRKFRKLTFIQFSMHYRADEHGGYTEEQVLNMWKQDGWPSNWLSHSPCALSAAAPRPRPFAPGAPPPILKGPCTPSIPPLPHPAPAPPPCHPPFLCPGLGYA